MSSNGFRGRVSQVRILPDPLPELPGMDALPSGPKDVLHLDPYNYVTPTMQEATARTMEGGLAQDDRS